MKEKNIEIDYTYAKAPKFHRPGSFFLPFAIQKDTASLKPETDKYFLKLNEHTIKLDVHSEKDAYKAGIKINLGTFLFFSVLLPICFSIIDLEVISFGLFFVLLLIGSPFLYLAHRDWQKEQKSPEEKHVLFNRLESTITMPKINEVDYFTVPFEHLKAVKRAIPYSIYTSHPELHFFNDTDYWRPWKPEDFLRIPSVSDPLRMWSYFVWYMDKNRPLPPSEAFNEFRDKDFERRKAAGFPPPLFKSLVPTPEATAEQQLVREAFWKDEDYIATKGEATYTFNPLNKHYKGFDNNKK